MLDFRKSAAALAVAMSVGGMFATPVPAAAQTTLKAVMNSDLKILDPIWTTAYVQRGFGYMVWDTLFSVDDKFAVKPQMVDKWSVSDDKLTWTFTLRDGLVWSDGKPVTSEDCIASIKRWGARDSMGQKMMASVAGFEAVDAKTFKMKMKEPYGLVLESLGKPSSNVLFIMPKKTADTDPMQQIKIEDVIGSGPFIFVAKVVKVDRVEWIWIPDAQTQVSALQNGEIDMIESPAMDLLPLIAKDKNLKLFDYNPLGNQYAFRFNTLFKPFDNPKIRYAASVAMGQEDYLKAAIGDPKYYKVCKAMFVCGTPLATDAGMENVLNQNAAKAREILKEAGYDGTPVVLMQSTDLGVLTNMAPVAKQQLEAAGFKVEMQSMDWQTLVGRRTKKDPPDKGGWSAFITSWAAADILNPVMAGFYNAACDKAMFGWPCDETIEKFRDQFAKETDPAKQKEIVENLQKYWVDHPTHINVGQWYAPLARRNSVEGNLIAPAPVFWNVTKK
jgi:peptide/nickel transport system substrate-binding protein